MFNLFSFNVFKELIFFELKSYKKVFPGKVLDTIIYTICLSLLNGYIMQKIGLAQEYGPFMMVGTAVTVSFFECMYYLYLFMMDLESSKLITYDLTLPVSSNVIFTKYAFTYALYSMGISMLIIPLGKLLIWQSFDLSNISIFKTIIIFILNNIFLGFFALWLSKFIKNLDTISHVWFRFVLPLWFFGCYQFPWKSFYEISPYLGYATLLNPLVYTMEGMRNAVLGSEGSLNFGLCIFMLLVFTTFFAIDGMRHLRHRLDCI